MIKLRVSRMLLIGAATLAAITGVTFASVTASNASGGPTLNPPNMHATSTTAPADAGTCGYHFQIPADRFKGVPVFDPQVAAQPYVVKLHTTEGTITVQMNTSAAPCTTFSFRFLATQDYFNGTHCHRLTLQFIFVLQCGDPTGTGAGGPGYAFNDENLAGATYPAGTVAMANAGPNTNGSQFFFTWKDTTLPPLYTPFGTVTSGLDVLQKIAAAGDDQQNGPGDGYPNDYTQINFAQVIPSK
ncbi:MAG TPA: peptidylprolyl isomerase [Streptosporangiaceae bacterium]|nr:peptidylprolyl isomerase [Streptosporangiaceae bacterium]